MELTFNYKGRLTKVMDGDEMVKPRIFKKIKKQFPFLRLFLKEQNRDCITATEQGIIGYI
jgi:hypothetical protein